MKKRLAFYLELIKIVVYLNMLKLIRNNNNGKDWTRRV